MSDWTDDERAVYDETQRLIKNGDRDGLAAYISGLSRETIDRVGGIDKRPTPWVTPGKDYELPCEGCPDPGMPCLNCPAELDRLRRALQVSQEHNIEQGKRIEALQDERDALRERLERQALRGTDDE